VTLEAEHQIEPAGSAAIVFQALATSEFESTLRDTEEVVKATCGDSGTTVATEDDSYGYRWMILRNAPRRRASKTWRWDQRRLQLDRERGHGERLLAAVFAFVDAQSVPSTSSTTTSAASGIRSCPIRPIPSSASPSASCS